MTVAGVLLFSACTFTSRAQNAPFIRTATLAPAHSAISIDGDPILDTDGHVRPTKSAAVRPLCAAPDVGTMLTKGTQEFGFGGNVHLSPGAASANVNADYGRFLDDHLELG